MDIFTRHANKALNWETYETFKAAIGMGLVRAPMFDLAKLELTFLQDTGGKVEPPETGPVQTKDVADCMAILTHTLIGDQIAAIIGQQLGALTPRPVAASQGGIRPYSEEEIPWQHRALSNVGRPGERVTYPNFPNRRPVNPDGTFARGWKRQRDSGLPRHRS